LNTGQSIFTGRFIRSAHGSDYSDLDNLAARGNGRFPILTPAGKDEDGTQEYV
jgi:hypothetical protein